MTSSLAAEGQMEEEASGSSEAYVDTEYGRGYSVTFHDVTNPGDLALLEPIEDLLTGAGAIFTPSSARRRRAGPLFKMD